VQDWIDLVMSMWRGVVVSLGGDVSGTFFLLLWELDHLKIRRRATQAIVATTDNKKISRISGGRLVRGKSNKEVRRNGVHLAKPMNLAMPRNGCYLIGIAVEKFGS
jgi:hypothetical protein